MRRISKARSPEEKREIYKKWNSLINMSQSALDAWAENDERLLASINRSEAKDSGGIQSGYDSFHRIKRRKSKPFEEWSAQDFDNASQENGFNSRMLGNEPGPPIEGTRKSKWEISLKNWGHDPSLKSSPQHAKYKAWREKHFNKKKASIQRVASMHIASMPRQACVIGAKPFDDRIVLFKNRDRNYNPDIKVVHDRLDGVEMIYMLDTHTGWCEGINEYGISAVNSALMVIDDEKDNGKVNERLGLKDGEVMRKVLSCKTVEEAADAICSVRGVLGHNFITDGTQIVCVERTKKGVEKGLSGETHRRRLNRKKTHVRTNHGIWNPATGYQYGENKESSLVRRSRAQKILRGVRKVEDIAPSVYRSKFKRLDDPFNVTRTESASLWTSTHVVFDPLNLKLMLYIVPEYCGYEGYEKRFSGPSKCVFEVYEHGTSEHSKPRLIDTSK